MPRTKRAKTVKAPKNHSNKPEKLEWGLQLINGEEEREIELLESKNNELLTAITMLISKELAKLPAWALEKTLTDIENGELDDLSQTKSILSTTRSIRKNTTLRMRSISLNNGDEGYTTAESSDGNSGNTKQKSRQRERKQHRSASSSRASSRTTSQLSQKTPVNRQPNSSCVGTITPKCKMNAPQILLRRPKKGELAVSYQGSPLLVGPVANEEYVNINIPMPDGNTLSMLPERMQHTSELPRMPCDIRSQLEILRDNLVKMCNELN